MNTDPTYNTMAFRLRGGDGDRVVVTQVPTRADDGVSQAWEVVSRQHNAEPADVSELECEWEPTESDLRYVGKAFPGCQVRYNFSRPTDPDLWDSAFDAARQTIQAAMAQQLRSGATVAADEARQAHEETIRNQVRAALAGRRRPDAAGARGTPATPDPGASGGGEDVDDRLRRLEAAGGRKLLPVIIGPSSGRGRALLEFDFLVRYPLVPEKVFVALALAGLSPRKTVLLEWFSRNHYQQVGEPPFHDLLAFAGSNLREGVVAKRYTSAHDGDLLTFEREEHMAASLVVWPDFYAEMSKQLGTERLIIGIQSSEFLVVADADSGNAYGVRGSTLEAGCDGDFIGPTVLLMERNGIQVLAERQI